MPQNSGGGVLLYVNENDGSEQLFKRVVENVRQLCVHTVGARQQSCAQVSFTQTSGNRQRSLLFLIRFWLEILIWELVYLLLKINIKHWISLVLKINDDALSVYREYKFRKLQPDTYSLPKIDLVHEND